MRDLAVERLSAAKLRRGADCAEKNVDWMADYAYFSNGSWMIGAAEGEPEGSPAYLLTVGGKCIKKTHQDSPEIDEFISRAVKVTK